MTLIAHSLHLCLQQSPDMTSLQLRVFLKFSEAEFQQKISIENQVKNNKMHYLQYSSKLIMRSFNHLEALMLCFCKQPNSPVE